MHDGWMYQGRQYHMWFGRGTKPVDGSSAADGKADLGPIDERIHDLGHTLVAGLPASKRHHPAARLGVDDHVRLDRVMKGVVRVLPLGPRGTALRVLGMHPDGRGIGAFVEAGHVLASAQTHADLRAATGKVAASAQEMGLDNFKPFLRRADDHLTDRGGLQALMRDLPKPVPAVPASAAPPPEPPQRSAQPSIGADRSGDIHLAQAWWLPLLLEEPPAIVRPPLEAFPRDATKPPGPGFEWKGRPGSEPGSREGNWYNPETGEVLRPDMSHPEPIGPHYDYRSPGGEWYRWFPNGNVLPKA